MDVSGKVAIVTGGGSGIGLEFVKLLHSKGCRAVIGDLRLAPEAQEFVENSEKLDSTKVLFKETDVTVWRQMTELFDFTEQSLGPPDIVCPAAGIFEPTWSQFWTEKEDQGYKTIQINVEHPVKATRLAISSFFRTGKPGIVLHISSIAAQTASLSIPIYCASKAFVSHFVRSFASLQGMENIRVIAIAPGLVHTPLWYKENPEKYQSVANFDRWLQPLDIAQVMLDMCQDSAYVGGSVVEVTTPGKTRKVQLFNDEGPPGARGSTGDPSPVPAHILEIIESEKRK